MGKHFSTIDDTVRKFIEAQPVFFVGSAPLNPDGHVNVSPKGLDTLRVLGPRTIAYLDLTGSGIETVSHVKENGRIVLMFCAFQGPPKIVRLYGRGRVIEPSQSEFPDLAARFPEFEDYRRTVPRLFPRLRASQRGTASFSADLYWKHREYNAAIGAALIAAVLVTKALWFR